MNQTSQAPKVPILQRLRNNFRYRLAHSEALPQLSILGLAIGIITALIIAVFRIAIDGPLSLWLPGNASENFEGLSPEMRFALPVIGAILIATALHFTPKKYWAVSAPHVLDRLRNFQGRMPLGNVLVQFFGAIAALLSGQSVGREGPAVHLGAGSASLLGQWLKLPDNSLRPMIGCGVAAAIGASFNTPVAGVIFAMEVILMEYTIAGFIPVILAAVAGTTINIFIFGEHSVLERIPASIESLKEFPFLLVIGLITALVAACFIRLLIFNQRFKNTSIFIRLVFAGLLTGTVAIWVPEIMGTGYDTMLSAVHGDIALNTLLLIVIAKLLVTATVLGLGMPAGVIGPTLMLGACLGGALGMAGHHFYSEVPNNPGFYVLLGMGGMMAAILNAPLAALIALLELTKNSEVLLPGMLVIVIACLGTRLLFGCQGIFQEILIAQGKDIHQSQMDRVLARAGVTSVMNRNIISCDQNIDLSYAQQLLSHHPAWLAIDCNHGRFLLRPVDLQRELDRLMESDQPKEHQDINLLEIAAQRIDCSSIHTRANLLQAQALLEQENTQALLVESPQKMPGLTTQRYVGAIERQTLENYYRHA